MAESEVKDSKAVAAKPKGKAVKRTNEKLGFFARVKKWFRDMKSELAKVIWPTPKTILKNTAVALAIMFASAVVLWGFDWVASHAVQALITLTN